jgi:hypothetical protein
MSHKTPTRYKPLCFIGVAFSQNVLFCNGWAFQMAPATRLRHHHRSRHLQITTRLSTLQRNHDTHDEEEDYDDDDDDFSSPSFPTKETDWMEAELTLRQAPTHPHPSLDAHQVALITCRSLQNINYPLQNDGLERCFSFFTYDCRKAVTARQGADSIKRFVRYALHSPALQPFMGAHRIEFGQSTKTAAQPPIRGAMISIPIRVTPTMLALVQHFSGMVRNGVASELPTRSMIMRLEQQRRPPNQDCWLVKELVDVRYVFAGDMGNAGVAG